MNYSALKTFTNEALFEEVAQRLKRMHLDAAGREFKFGEIVFVFRDGKLQGVEERSKIRIFRPKNTLHQSEPPLRPA